MISVTMYRADDGTVFSTAGECAQHETLCAECKAVDDIIPARPLSHGTYRQHDPALVLAFWRGVVGLGRKYAATATPEWNGYADEEIHPRSVFGRIVDDIAPRPVSRLWARLSRFTKDGREFDQPYFAIHPNEARPETP